MLFTDTNSEPISEKKFEEVSKEIDVNLNSKDWDAVYKTTSSFLGENGRNIKVFNFLVEKIDYISIELLKESKLDNHTTEQAFINLLGVIAFYLNEKKDALNLYVLCLLKDDGGREGSYLHNIGSALMLLGEFKNAIHYLKLSIKNAREKVSLGEDSNTINLRSINLAQALIYDGRYREAKEILERTDVSKMIIGTINRKQLLTRISEDYLNGKISIDKEKLADLEVKLRQDEDKNNLSSLLAYRYDYCSDLTLDERESILLERYEIYKNYIDVFEYEDLLLKLIRFYEENRKEDQIHKFSYELYKRESAKSDEIRKKIMLIYLRFNRHFFENLKFRSQESLAQKTELQDLTFILSHDLVSPIRNITSFTQLIKNDLRSSISEDSKQYIEYVNSATNDLNTIVSNLKDLNELNTLSNKSAEVSLEKALNYVWDSLKEKIESKNANIIVNGQLPMLRMKPIEINALIKNLIDNAIKFNTSKVPKVEINTYLTKNYFSIEIADNGIGIDQAYKEKIFSYFKKLHSDDSYEGVGFGLGICSKIVNSYNGKIRVKDRKGGGSIFKISFPSSIVVEDSQG